MNKFDKKKSDKITETGKCIIESLLDRLTSVEELKDNPIVQEHKKKNIKRIRRKKLDNIDKKK